MTHDEIEFLISQHFDRTLEPTEAQKLRAFLDSDASAQQLFKEHDRLDRALKSSHVDLGIDQEWLTSQIAGHIDEAQFRTFKISRWMLFAPMAAAAMLLIGLTLGVIFFKDYTEAPVSSGIVAASVEVGLPNAGATGIAVADVSVGVPSNMTPAMMSTLFLADRRHSGRVVIQPAGQMRQGPFD